MLRDECKKQIPPLPTPANKFVRRGPRLRCGMTKIGSRWKSVRDGNRFAIEIGSRWKSVRDRNRFALEIGSRWMDTSETVALRMTEVKLVVAAGFGGGGAGEDQRHAGDA